MENYNIKSPAVKRLMREAKELSCPSEEYYAFPLDENLFEWHFTIRGQPGTEFDGGLYHGRILLPSTYPMQPPYIIFMTPNGRFEVNKKICLSISGHHPETWQPSWSIRTALLALIAFMPSSGKGTIGSLDYTEDERKVLAEKSLDWICPECGISNAKFANNMSGDIIQDKIATEGATDEGPVIHTLMPPIRNQIHQAPESEYAQYTHISSQFHLLMMLILVILAVLIYRRVSRIIDVE